MAIFKFLLLTLKSSVELAIFTTSVNTLFIKWSVKPIHHEVWVGGKRHANAFKIKLI